MVFVFGYYLLLKKGIIVDNYIKFLFFIGVFLFFIIFSFIGLGVGYFIYEKNNLDLVIFFSKLII